MQDEPCELPVEEVVGRKAKREPRAALVIAFLLLLIPLLLLVAILKK
jgi:hypothetical protein